ncbi:TetR/AcrR family transcriptional regulator [Mucilaginibacter aquariorum]|uniref:TetR/AcrR family transcriptional regulator n=1 Tax=Mucilaginibacter aquariorum TaxID=2967225 RepID=A0ABT1T3C2_9SPHI|nr:TetR/AcrR family transcriptional regulator [Mucilaginibacter aquariorum]MCQ6959110.1 TetR/AcrR family transcriptional regulator [Mucilaginibacter aquariorum]
MRDKEQTKRKLINAVAQVFKNEGYAGLGVNKIARLAGTDKKLILPNSPACLIRITSSVLGSKCMP